MLVQFLFGVVETLTLAKDHKSHFNVHRSFWAINRSARCKHFVSGLLGVLLLLVVVVIVTFHKLGFKITEVDLT